MVKWEKKTFKESKNPRNYRDQWKYQPPELYRKHEKVYYLFRRLRTIGLFEKAFYLENYTKLDVLDYDYIKPKDQDGMKDLLSYFSQKEAD